MAGSFSREKLRQAPQKEGGEILCDSGWCVHKSNVQNKWDDHAHTHTHTLYFIEPISRTPDLLVLHAGSFNRPTSYQ